MDAIPEGSISEGIFDRRLFVVRGRHQAGEATIERLGTAKQLDPGVLLPLSARVMADDASGGGDGSGEWWSSDVSAAAALMISARLYTLVCQGKGRGGAGVGNGNGGEKGWYRKIFGEKRRKNP